MSYKKHLNNEFHRSEFYFLKKSRFNCRVMDVCCNIVELLLLVYNTKMILLEICHFV